MHVSILTPDMEVYQGEASSVTVPGVSGRFQILDRHAPIVSALEEGFVEVKTAEGQDLRYNIEKGFVEVLNNKVNVLVQGLTKA